MFSEFITGCIDVNRMYRISDRVIAIQMAIDGADFIEVYRFFLERKGKTKNQAFEDARRVFRGGVLTGGAPFTKPETLPYAASVFGYAASAGTAATGMGFLFQAGSDLKFASSATVR